MSDAEDNTVLLHKWSFNTLFTTIKSEVAANAYSGPISMLPTSRPTIFKLYGPGREHGTKKNI